MTDTIFKITRELRDVTSIHRPDTNWKPIDAAGHRHFWTVVATGKEAQRYSPESSYDVTSVKWVVDGTRVDEDGEEYEVGHHECKECGEVIKPGFTADTDKQFIGGLLCCFINDEPVSKDEYQRRFFEVHGRDPFFNLQKEN